MYYYTYIAVTRVCTPYICNVERVVGSLSQLSCVKMRDVQNHRRTTSQTYCKPLPVLVPPNGPYTRPRAPVLPFKGALEVLENDVRQGPPGGRYKPQVNGYRAHCALLKQLQYISQRD